MLSLEQKRHILEMAGYKFTTIIGGIYIATVPDGGIRPAIVAAKSTQENCINYAWEHYNAQA